MALPIRFPAGSSTGVSEEIGETRDVVVTAEAIDPATGYGGDTVTYTATVKDSTGASLPATFVASLMKNGDPVISDQVFDAAHYDQATGLLTLQYTRGYPAGTFTIKLEWAEQLI